MSSRQRTQTQSSACLSFALPGGRSRRTVRCSSSSAPRSVRVGRCSTVSARAVQAVDGDDGAKWARTRVRTRTDLPT